MNTEKKKTVPPASEQTQTKKAMIRGGVSLALGMLVLFWRCILPANVEITVVTMILINGLDLALTVTLILINKKQLKEAFSRKFGKKELIITLLCIVAYILLSIATDILRQVLDSPQSAADFSAEKFISAYPVGALVALSVSMGLLAPIWEEIAFRMSGRNIIKNPVLYVLITSYLFAFIHTVDFLALSNLQYIVPGVFLSLVYLKTKDIRITMAIHYTNLIGLVIAITNSTG